MTERIVLDLSGTEDATTESTFEALPKGLYKVAIYSAEFKETKQGGNPYLRARLNITQEGKFFRRVVFDNFIALYSTEKAKFMTAKAEQLARISGLWDGADRTKAVLPLPEDIQGLEVEAFITKKVDEYAMEQYEKDHGEEPEEPIYRNDVSSYRPVGGWPKPGDEGQKTSGKKKNITL